MLSDKMRKIYQKSNAEALFLEQDFLRRYVTDYYTLDGFVVLDENAATLVVDPRYLEAAENALKNSCVQVVDGGYREALDLLKGKKTIGIAYPFTSATRFHALKNAGFELIDCMPAMQETMAIKSEEELSLIQTACDIAEDALLMLLPELKEGVSETEAAAYLEYCMRKKGASGVSFETIVAFGANGSVPHHQTGASKLKFGDIVLIDFGCKYKGYCSDCTRTMLFGDDKKHEEFKTAYRHVLTAHNLVKEKLVAGMTGREGDAIARDYFREQGIHTYFTHSLGHGIGLQIHEYPFLAPHQQVEIQNGMVFSDEPGLYYAGKFGVRIEDSVTMKNGKVVSFMKKTERDLVIL